MYNPLATALISTTNIIQCIEKKNKGQKQKAKKAKGTTAVKRTIVMPVGPPDLFMRSVECRCHSKVMCLMKQDLQLRMVIWELILLTCMLQFIWVLEPSPSGEIRHEYHSSLCGCYSGHVTVMHCSHSRDQPCCST